MEKSAVLAAIRAVLADELAAQLQTASDARDEATSEESRPENKYDTRSLEASYLAGALSERLLVLKRLCSFFAEWSPPDFTEDDPIAVGALIALEEGDRERWCLLVPQGGRTVQVGGRPITLLSPASPMGRALVDAFEGDEVEVRTPRGVRSIAVISVQ